MWQQERWRFMVREQYWPRRYRQLATTRITLSSQPCMLWEAVSVRLLAMRGRVRSAHPTPLTVTRPVGGSVNVMVPIDIPF